jgi:ATP-dependent HslUV protease ATP-binding subunit HslU
MYKNLIPKEVVRELDKHIIGQAKAKRFVATALRNRWRRMQISDLNMQKEILPKNILLIGPTGVGKTEIARRLAKLANAPFIKIEATKFTEVGYVGRDVESMIRDLAEIAYKKTHKQEIEKVQDEALELAKTKVVDALLPKNNQEQDQEDTQTATKELFLKKLNNGDLDDRDVEIDLDIKSFGVEIMSPPGMEEMTNQLQGVLQSLSNTKSKKQKMKVRDALKALQEDEANKLINEEEIRNNAVDNLEQNGIIFIDEFDKITHRSSSSSSDVSREGVQRDLLPIVEGSSVSTKYGVIHTDHILFIASGAFHMSKPSDLIPELQGRFPVRVELKALTVEEFEQILQEPNASLTKQYIELLKTEDVAVKFEKDGINAIAIAAWKVNESTENIGARRLHTVLETILEDISYNVEEHKGKTISIDKDYVNSKIETIVANDDLARYIL